MPNLPLCYWSSQLFDLRAPLSTDVPVLLLNQPNVSLSKLAERGGGTGGQISLVPKLSLRSKRFQSSYCAKVRTGAKKRGGRGRREDQICHARKQSIPGLIDVSSAK